MSGRRCRVPSRFSVPHLIREEVPKPPQCPSGIAAATRMAGAQPKLLQLARGLVILKAEIKGNSSCVSEFSSLLLLAKNCIKCTKQQVLVTDAFSNHKTILKVQQVSAIKSFTFLNTILMLEILKSFIHECLCFTSCKAHPHKIHDRLQQRQIMIGC